MLNITINRPEGSKEKNRGVSSPSLRGSSNMICIIYYIYYIYILYMLYIPDILTICIYSKYIYILYIYSIYWIYIIMTHEKRKWSVLTTNQNCYGFHTIRDISLIIQSDWFRICWQSLTKHIRIILNYSTIKIHHSTIITLLNT